MAARPWATPDEIKAYSDSKSVKDRSIEKLKLDISRAESYVIKYTNNRFEDEKYSAIPEPVKIAVILLAELYAESAAELKEHSGNFKSESFDEYSYSVADTSYRINNLDLSNLLDDYIVKNNGTVNMKLRKL